MSQIRNSETAENTMKPEVFYNPFTVQELQEWTDSALPATEVTPCEVSASFVL